MLFISRRLALLVLPSHTQSTCAQYNKRTTLTTPKCKGWHCSLIGLRRRQRGQQGKTPFWCSLRPPHTCLHSDCTTLSSSHL